MPMAVLRRAKENEKERNAKFLENFLFLERFFTRFHAWKFVVWMNNSTRVQTLISELKTFDHVSMIEKIDFKITHLMPKRVE